MPPRVRSSGYESLSSCILHYWLTRNNYDVTQEKGTVMAGEHRECIDILTPHYHRRKWQGEILNNACSIQRDSYKCTSEGSISIDLQDTWGSETVKGDLCQFVGGVQDGVSVSELEQKRIQNAALVKAYVNMNSSPVLGGEILSDISKTASMLRRPFKGAIDLLGQLTKRRNRLLESFGGNVTKANAKAWLELRYGWKPVIQDGIEAVLQGEKILRKLNTGFRVARGEEKSAQREHRYSFDAGILGGSFIAVGTGFNEARFASNVGVIYRMMPTSLSDQTRQALGLNARSIPATLWEIVPFSFVADWFINIGPFLEAISPRSDIQVLTNWESSTYYMKKTLSGTVKRVIQDADGQEHVFTGTLGSTETIGSSFVRRVDLSLPFTPSLKFTSLTGKQSVDALALMAGKIVHGLYGLRH
jgi:hypothetical protein